MKMHDIRFSILIISKIKLAKLSIIKLKISVIVNRREKKNEWNMYRYVKTAQPASRHSHDCIWAYEYYSSNMPRVELDDIIPVQQLSSPNVSSQQLRKHPPRELSPKYLRRGRILCFSLVYVRSAKREIYIS